MDGYKITGVLAVFLVFIAAVLVATVSAQTGQSGNGSEFRPPPSLKKVEGTIIDAQTYDLVGIDETHQFIRIRNEEGKSELVDLGPVQDLGGWNFEKDDRITVYGLEGTLDGKPVFMAFQIDENGRKEIMHPDDLNLQRIRAKVLKTRTSTVENHDVPEQLFARIEWTGRGIVTVADLGPIDNYPADLRLEGKQIHILARPASIGGRSALVAEAVRLPGGKVIDVDWSLPDSGVEEGSAEQEQWYDPSDWFDTDKPEKGEKDWYDYTFGYTGPRDYYEENEVLGYYEGEGTGIYDEEERQNVYEKGRTMEEEHIGRDESGVGSDPYDYYTEKWWNEQISKDKE